MSEFIFPQTSKAESPFPIGIPFIDPVDNMTKMIDDNGDVHVAVPMINDQAYSVGQSVNLKAQGADSPKINFSMKFSGELTPNELASLQLIPSTIQRPHSDAQRSSSEAKSIGISTYLPLYNQGQDVISSAYTINPTLLPDPGKEYTSPETSADIKSPKKNTRLHWRKGKISKFALASTVVVSLAVLGGLSTETINDANDIAKECASSVPLLGPNIASRCEIGQFALHMTDFSGLFYRITGNK